jgi:NTP pyrophosphatase (non-canonical NTP hydrolase)
MTSSQTAAVGGQDFLHQLRRVNTERYEAWVGEEPLMMCEHCGRGLANAKHAGSTHCNAPFDVQLHNFTKPHPYLKSSGDAGIMFDALELGGEVGELLNIVKKLEREERGWRGSRADPAAFADECADVLICLDKLARRRNVDLIEATVAKFNATSDKVGLPQKLALQQAEAGDE